MASFKRANRSKAKLRLALDGPAGAGKSMTALRLAYALAKHEAAKRGEEELRIAVIDTEMGSISKYANIKEESDGGKIYFDVVELESFSPARYTEKIEEAGDAKFDVLVIDSLSHAWAGKDGALDQVDKKAQDNRGNSFTAWKDVTPQHRRLIETMLSAPLHLIVTMRTKMEYVLEEKTTKEGRTITVPRKIGTKPIQREGMEYEFDVVADLDVDHIMTISKTRCPSIDGQVVHKPGPEFMRRVIDWLDTGESKPVEWKKTGITDEQIKKILASANELGMSNEDVRAETWKSYTAETLQDLSRSQGENYATKLAAKIRNAKPTPPAETAKPVEQPKPAEQPVEQQNNDFSNMVTRDTLYYLRHARAELWTAIAFAGDLSVADVSEQNKRWAAMLSKRGVTNETALTEGQAIDLAWSCTVKMRSLYTEAGAPENAPDWLWPEKPSAAGSAAA